MKRFYPQRKNGRFYEIGKKNHQGWFLPTMILLFESLKRGFCRSTKIEAAKWAVKPSYKKESYEPIFTWLGHSTFLIQVGGKNILTDPIFGNLSWIFSRIISQKINIEGLPRIDYVVISHNHPDHMDSNSLQELQIHFPEMKILTPMGDKAWFDYRGFNSVSEHMWWDEIKDNGLTFTFLPAKHWSQRGLFDKNKSLWGSWMIDYNGFKFYFAGDTGWSNHFSVIGNIYKSIDVALMPIGPGEPRLWMKYSHINAEEAGNAFLKLKARCFVPMHWGTFHLGFDKFKEPLSRLKIWWQKNKKKCTNKALRVAKVGELVRCAQEKIVHLSKIKSKTINVV